MQSLATDLSMTTSAPAAARPAARPTLWARVLAGFLSLVLALALAELIATCAMGGAYPTLNLYERDAVYGVHLTPEASTRVVSPNGVMTDITTNALGFRGGEWPSQASAMVPGRVLVVGDSQVMGWGVPEASAFTAQLQGFEVLAAGVPTWGPLEYVHAVGELVPRYRPERVVFVLNAANDWMEAPLPNLRRTTARDGWARVPMGPGAGGESFTDFPLRRFLLGRSHLVLALRLMLDPPPHGLPPAIAMQFVSELPLYLRPDAPYQSRLTRSIEKARAVCQRFGCEVVPVLLPMDIQVDPGEWAKYRVAAQDTRPSLALASALQADVPDLVDLRPTLTAASPGAFLSDDYHLSAAGHAAVATALRERLALRTDTRLEPARGPAK